LHRDRGDGDGEDVHPALAREERIARLIHRVETRRLTRTFKKDDSG
jgi:hypothetical protein